MKTKLLLGVLFVVATLMGLFGSVFAAGFEYDIAHDITIGDNLATTVKTVVQASSSDGTTPPGTITVPLHGTDPINLKATDGDGGDVPVTKGDNELTLRLNSIQAKRSSKWNITVTYTSTSGLAIGSSTVFMVEPHDYGELNIAREQVRITSWGELGTFVTRGVEPNDKSSVAGSFVNVWENDQGALSSGFGLLFGDNALSSISFNKTLTNDSYWWQNQSIVLPPDTNQQKVFINTISPEPHKVRLDEDGNVIVEFRLRPRQTIEVSAELEIAINSYTYSLESSLLTNDIDPVLIDRYTNLTEAWADTQLEIDDVATTPVVDIVRQIYEGLAESQSDPAGDGKYEKGIARSNALIGELRANGIPARLVVGAVFGDGAKVFQIPQPGSWSEVYIPDVGWVTLDLNFEQHGSYFGVTDVQRIALALRGFDPEYPPENSASFTINFLDSEPPAVPVMKPEISATKHVIIPGFSINTLNVSMPGGVIVDNAGFVVGNSPPVSLGSLAPLQRVGMRSTSFLVGAFTSESVQYGVFSNGALTDSDVIAQATMKVSYLPMILLLVAGFATWIFSRFIWPKLRKDKTPSTTSKKEKSGKQALKMSSDNYGGDIENVDMLAALDLPDDDQVEIPIDTIPEKEQLTSTESSERQPAPTINAHERENTSPTQPAQPTSLSLEGAHQATPEEIKREMHKNRPKNLIQ